MYSDFGNHFIHMTRYGLAFLIVFVLWPRLLFRGGGEGGLDRLVSGYIKMVCLIIVAGYILVIIKLYEFISLAAVLLFLTFRNAVYRDGRWGGPRELKSRIVTSVYDVFDGLVHPLQAAGDWGRKRAEYLKGAFYQWFGSFAAAGNTLLLAAIFVFAAYLRFYDAVVHAAPAMSDAYVTMAWMKYIERRELFHDGIYPQGFHIYLSVLRKFSAMDPLYVLKYTGPLNGVLTTLGIYFAVSRFTGRKSPGIAAAFVFGVLSGFLPMDWQRQASTNSQEFALVFLLPALYFASSYIKTSKKEDLWTAAACFSVIGLVHSLVFAFLAVGVLCLVASRLMLNFRQSLRASWHISLAGMAAGVLSLFPVAVGLAMGKEFHSSSAQFVIQGTTGVFPQIDTFGQVALAGFILFLVISVLSSRSGKGSSDPLFLTLTGLASSALYLALGPLTGKAVLNYDRMALFWSLMLPVGVGLGWFSIFRLVPWEKVRRPAETILCAGIMVCAVIYLKPSPAMPYKMQYNSVVEQYLRISEEFRPTQWALAASEENYAICLGKAWHLRLSDLLSFNPGGKPLARQVDGREEVLSTRDVFIIMEKNMFRNMVSGAEKEQEAIYEKRAREYLELGRWLERYRSTHDNLSLFYEDADIQVFRIHQPRAREEEFRELWGGRGKIGRN